MIHILLLILKIIGIILGVLLAVLLIGLCIALFVPVRYQLEAWRTEEEGAPPIEVKGSVTWLLHFVNVHFRYPADIYLRARLFLFTVFRLPPKQKNEESGNRERKKKDKKDSNSGKETKEARSSGSEANKKDEPLGSIENQKDNESRGSEGSPSGEGDKKDEESSGGEGDKKNEESSGGEANEKDSESLSGESDKEDGENSPRLSILEKIRSIFRQIRRIFQNIWYTLKGICDKIKTIRENIEYYMGVLKSDTFQKAFSLCKEELFSILSYIRPRKFQADLTIGMDDPATTGKILSYYGMLYPLIGGHVNIVPDFERKRMEGAVLIKGKVRLFTFIKAAVRLYFSKDIRKMLRLFKKEDA